MRPWRRGVRTLQHQRDGPAEAAAPQVGERIWLVTFMRYDLGYFDDETCRLERIDNPFTPKVLPMSFRPSDTAMEPGLPRRDFLRTSGV